MQPKYQIKSRFKFLILPLHFLFECWMLFSTTFPVLTCWRLVVSSQPLLVTDICNMWFTHTVMLGVKLFKTVHCCIRNTVTVALSRFLVDGCPLIIALLHNHCCVLSNSGLSNATSKRPKLAFFRGKICPPQSRNYQNRILHISKIGNLLPVFPTNNSLRNNHISERHAKFGENR